jgi:hypothetical protein
METERICYVLARKKDYGKIIVHKTATIRAIYAEIIGERDEKLATI